MGVTYFKTIEAYFRSIPTDKFSKDMLKKVRETKEAYDELKAKEIDLVRCGECSWYEKPSCRWHNIDNKPTDFCSYGERRADEHTD